MFEGRYIRWSPGPGLDGLRLCCEALHDDWEGVRIWFRREDGGPMVIVRFPSVMLYLNTQTSSRLAPLNTTSSLAFPHTFWRVEESSLVESFKKQAVGTRDKFPIVHYAFLSTTDCIDVLSTEEPTFTT
jgi:hypothetical protein